MDHRLDLTYQKHFASQRPDGRHVAVMAAQMARMRRDRAELALPDGLDQAGFADWQRSVIQRLTDRLNLPAATPQPAPLLLSRTQQDGYRVEKWELYPDDYTVVPFLVLVPDMADEQAPVPGVICFPDAGCPKEFSAGLPPLDHPNCRYEGSEDERMALHVVRAGMAAIVFDNPGDGECSVWSDPAAGSTQAYVRDILCHGLLEMGLSYAAVSVFQKLRFLDSLDALPYIDADRVGLCAHGLGTDSAIMLGLLSPKVRCLVFNDILRDARYTFGATTEHHEVRMEHELDKWQVLSGRMSSFGFQDLCAAFAPRPLALTEGGADPFVDTVRRAYALCGARDALRVSYYPPYDREEARTLDRLPELGLSRREFDRYSYVDGVARTFRAQPALRLLTACLLDK